MSASTRSTLLDNITKVATSGGKAAFATNMEFAVFPNVVNVCLPRSLTEASPCSYHRTVISRSDDYSVVKDHGGRSSPLIFLGQRGVKIQPCCRKKYSVFSAGSDILHHIQKHPLVFKPSEWKNFDFSFPNKEQGEKAELFLLPEIFSNNKKPFQA